MYMVIILYDEKELKGTNIIIHEGKYYCQVCGELVKRATYDGRIEGIESGYFDGSFVSDDIHIEHFTDVDFYCSECDTTFPEVSSDKMENIIYHNDNMSSGDIQ